MKKKSYKGFDLYDRVLFVNADDKSEQLCSIVEFLPTGHAKGDRFYAVVKFDDGVTCPAAPSELRLAPVILYSTLIDDYDQLRNDYLDDCRVCGYEPIDDGQFLWHRQNCEDDIAELEEEIVPDLLSQRPDSLYLAVGSAGTWRGRRKGGRIMSDLWLMLCQLMGNMDEFKVSLEDGHLHTEGYHHDGCNIFDIYRLNDKGERLYQKESERMDDEELHDKLTDSYYHIAIKNPFK